MSGGRPVPTSRTVLLLLFGVLPFVLRARYPSMTAVGLLMDGLVLLAAAVDFLRAPTLDSLTATRSLEPVLSAGVSNAVVCALERTDASRPLRGELRDEIPPGLVPTGHRQSFTLLPGVHLTRLFYTLVPSRRGDFALGNLHLRLLGPLGLMQRQGQVTAATSVKVYPNLQGLKRDALASEDTRGSNAQRLRRRPGEGREFDSLREWRNGDDMRGVDWKATARRGAPMVRIHRPEQNQSVLLFLDCGRQMAGRAQGQKKLDFAMEATLRLARAGLGQGDRVGLVRFAREVQAYVPPQKGKAHLRTLCHALYTAEATLEESDYGQAFEWVFAKTRARSLVVVLTDILDEAGAMALHARLSLLRHRHLTLVVSLLDEDTARAAAQVPSNVRAAHVRTAALRLEDDARLAVLKLRRGGTRVVRTVASRLSAELLTEYWDIKDTGKL